MKKPDIRSNRLAKETSPYLLQHAHNPVDWYPWGQEAFDRAKEEDKPIFLSVGYSTCHWCHVMERESFENEEIAELFNEYVVAVKVDREERPDIDQLYMTFVQAMTGQGGWPMNLLLTPDLKPFYAGTYIPPEPRYGMPGIREVLTAIGKLWQGDRAKLLDYSDTLVERIRQLDRELTEGQGRAPDPSSVSDLVEYYARHFDSRHGGFSEKPKFPQPHVMTFLLNEASLHRNEKALEMAEKTLEEIFKGGIHDHAGGGYSRYSVDEYWLVPHFEKMLYDNAGLLESFARAYSITGRKLYKMAAEDIVNWLEDRMTDPSGAFYAAEDADSEGVEGKFYVFTRDEVERVTGGDKDFMKTYGVTEGGNFEGKNILNLLGARKEEPEALAETYAESLKKLKAFRDQRIRPHLDDKILASWNGRMISALSIAGRIFGERKFTALARRAMEAVLQHMWRDGVLAGSMREGRTGGKGVQEDYAAVSLALIHLYEAEYNERDLKLALEIFQAMEEEFKVEGGGYRMGNRESGLIHNPVEAQDSAMAGGNSLAGQVLLKLTRLLFLPELEPMLDSHFARFGSVLKEYPEALPALTDVLNQALSESRELILAGPYKEELLTLAETLQGRGPETSLVILAGDSEGFSDNEFLSGLPLDRPGLYQCSGRSCGLPVTGREAICQRLQDMTGSRTS